MNNNLIYPLTVVLAGLICSSGQAQEQLFTQPDPPETAPGTSSIGTGTFVIDFKQPDPPDDAPEGRSGGAGQRGDMFFCPINALTPLVPSADSSLESNPWGFTTTESPTMWVNIDYQEDLLEGEEEFSAILVVADRITGKELSSTSVQLPKKSGSFSFTLPQPLEQNKGYRWSLSVNCFPEDPTSTTYVSTQAIVYRKEPLPEINPLSENPTANEYLQRIRSYADGGVWYDALQESAQLYCVYPDRPEVQESWNSLLGNSEVQLNSLALTPPLCSSPEDAGVTVGI